MGMTLAYFHSSGKMPVLIERLKIRVKYSDMRSGHSRSNLKEIPSRPVAFDLLRLDK